MLFAPCILILSYDINQQNAHFFKLVFSFLRYLHISNLWVYLQEEGTSTEHTEYRKCRVRNAMCTEHDEYRTQCVRNTMSTEHNDNRTHRV